MQNGFVPPALRLPVKLPAPLHCSEPMVARPDAPIVVKPEMLLEATVIAFPTYIGPLHRSLYDAALPAPCVVFKFKHP